MKHLLYPKLALTGIAKNRRIYIPFFLASAAMMMIFYITVFLSNSEFVEKMPGGNIMSSLLTMGWIVMLIFSAIFLFYTNSFLVKRRKTEFGLYNILGMGKMNIAKIIAWETLFTLVISLIAGISCGVLFSKLSEILLVKMMGGENVYAFNIDFSAILMEILVYSALFGIIFVNSLRQVRLSSAIRLLRSENSGEKPPKANWFAAVLGVLILGAAYYIAVTIEDPILAILAFLGAVVLVIIATYLLFIAGSVVLCRVLQKNKNYYYKTNHFVSTSQMAYRMRKNGAGLASICILCTMVLVTISATTCLYSGSEDMLRREYPRDIQLFVNTENEGAFSEKKGCFDKSVKDAGYTQSDITEFRYLNYRLNFDAFYVDDKLADRSEKGARQVFFAFIPLSDYNRAAGTSVELNPDEAIIIVDSYTKDRYYLDKIPVAYTEDTLNVKDYVRDFPTPKKYYREVDPRDPVYRTAIISDEEFEKVYAAWLKEATENPGQVTDEKGEVIGTQVSPVMCHYYGFNIPNCDDEKMSEIYRNAGKSADDIHVPGYKASRNTIAHERMEYYAFYSGLFFLGIIFSVVFIFSAALIMYYKQLSEGYEDKTRFDILQKVGMTKREVHSTINSQVLTVFFLPLAAAGMHTAFAFPLLSKMILLFGDMNVNYLALVALLCFAVFGVIYTAVYFITSKTYYKIVA